VKCSASSSDKPIQEFKLTIVTYATASVPFLATKCLNKLAEDNAQLHPKPAQMSYSDCYVDDLLSGSQTLAETFNFKKMYHLFYNRQDFP
jgi:hypothetical protein